MLEFKKLCDAYEQLTAAEKGLLLTEKSVAVLARLHRLSLPGVDPVAALAGFVIGSVTADGKINEPEYLLIYPALVCAFGEDFDFGAVKASFRVDGDGKKKIEEYTQGMLEILGALDEELRNDVITLCLCVTAIDGKISGREKRYIRRLCAG